MQQGVTKLYFFSLCLNLAHVRSLSQLLYTRDGQNSSKVGAGSELLQSFSEPNPHHRLRSSFPMDQWTPESAITQCTKKKFLSNCVSKRENRWKMLKLLKF